MKVVTGACTELGASQTENCGLQTGTTTGLTGQKHTQTGSSFLQTETPILPVLPRLVRKSLRQGIWSLERNPITCLDKELQTEPIMQPARAGS